MLIYKINYISISTSNFIGNSRYRSFSLLEHEKDLKFALINEKLNKVRDKYGIDAVRYGSEMGG